MVVINYILSGIKDVWIMLYTTPTFIPGVTWGGVFLGLAFMDIAIWGFKRMIGMQGDDD